MLLVQGLLCGVLQVIIQKLSDQDSSKAAVTQYADNVMDALLGVMACHSSTIHEEAMLAIGALTYACGPQFSKYMDRFYPYLQLGLKNYKVGQLTSILAYLALIHVLCLSLSVVIDNAGTALLGSGKHLGLTS